jgi:hypothetical protein
MFHENELTFHTIIWDGQIHSEPVLKSINFRLESHFS